MKISIIVEGDTERVFKPYLSKFLETRLKDRMPRLRFHPYHGRIPTGDKLKRIVENLLRGKNPADYVIALTDVYTGSLPPVFTDADDAKKKMRNWVGEENRFFPHAAQYDFEAWLLPFWDTIQEIARHNMKSPGVNPELVNHQKPPAYHIREIFEIGKCRNSYIKPRDAGKILRENSNNLLKSINSCSEFKSLVNTILICCDSDMIP